MTPELDWNEKTGKMFLVAPLNTDIVADQRRMYGKRLLRLRDYLKALPRNRYNHATLASKVVKGHPCGSVACAFGHAVISGKFPALNAKATVQFNDKGVADGDGQWDDDTIKFSVKKLRSEYHSEFDMEIPADEYFGPGAWNTIFDTDAYDKGEDNVTRSDVLRRIEAVAAGSYGVKG